VLAAALSATLALLGAAAVARAETPSPQGDQLRAAIPEPVLVRLEPPGRLPGLVARGSVGLGFGADGFGGRLSSSLTVWPFAALGGTVEYQRAGDGAELFGANEDFGLLSAGPSFRAPLGRFYAQADVLFGGGFGHSTAASSSFFDTPDRRELHGLGVTAALSLYWHPAFFELGPTVEFAFYDGANVSTLGFTLGIALFDRTQ